MDGKKRAHKSPNDNCEAGSKLEESSFGRSTETSSEYHGKKDGIPKSKDRGAANYCFVVAPPYAESCVETNAEANKATAVVATDAPSAIPEQGQSSKKRMRTSVPSALQEKISHEQRWNDMYHRVAAFRAKHGHCRVPNRFVEDSQLGFWVSAQRRQYKLMETTGAGASALTPERIRKLEEIDFQWSSTNPHHTPWEIRYEELREFVKKYGHAEVPIRWKENPKLSHWVSKQRHDFKLKKTKKSSRLSDDKVRKLNEVGFLWEGSRRSLKDKISLETPYVHSSDVEGEDTEELPAARKISTAAFPALATAAANALPALTAATSEMAPSAATIPPTVAAWGVQPPANSGIQTSSVVPPHPNIVPQNLSSEGFSQLLGPYLPPQQTDQPMIAALLVPIQALQNPGALNLPTLNATQSAPPAPITAQPAQPQGNNPVLNALTTNPGMSAVVNLLAQALAPVLMQQQQLQQQPHLALTQQLQAQALQQHLSFGLPQQQHQQAFVLPFQQLAQQQLAQQPRAQPQQQQILAPQQEKQLVLGQQENPVTHQEQSKSPGLPEQQPQQPPNAPLALGNQLPFLQALQQAMSFGQSNAASSGTGSEGGNQFQSFQQALSGNTPGIGQGGSLAQTLQEAMSSGGGVAAAAVHDQREAQLQTLQLAFPAANATVGVAIAGSANELTQLQALQNALSGGVLSAGSSIGGTASPGAFSATSTPSTAAIQRSSTNPSC